MSFTIRHLDQGSATPSAVWAVWEDVATWPTWDPAVEAVTLDRGVVEGSAGTMTLGGGIEVPVTVEVVEPGRRYVDVLTMGELRITIDHVVEPHDDGCEVCVTTTLEGPGAEDLGPMVSAEAPRAVALLLELAARP